MAVRSVAKVESLSKHIFLFDHGLIFLEALYFQLKLNLVKFNKTSVLGYFDALPSSLKRVELFSKLSNNPDESKCSNSINIQYNF